MCNVRGKQYELLSNRAKASFNAAAGVVSVEDGHEVELKQVVVLSYLCLPGVLIFFLKTLVRVVCCLAQPPVLACRWSLRAERRCCELSDGMM